MNPNLSLNVGTLVALIIALVAGGFLAGDIYDRVKAIEHQSIQNGQINNQTLANITTVSTVLNFTATQLLTLANDIRQGTNIQISEHGIHVDRELGDLNGNLTKLILSVNDTNAKQRADIQYTLDTIKEILINATR
jgi:hypothetical protein